MLDLLACWGALRRLRGIWDRNDRPTNALLPAQAAGPGSGIMALGLIFVGRAALTYPIFSATFDESFHIAAGIDHYQTESSESIVGIRRSFAIAWGCSLISAESDCLKESESRSLHSTNLRSPDPCCGKRATTGRP